MTANNGRHLTTRKSISRFSRFLIENLMENSMRLFSGYKNDSTKLKQFSSGLMQMSNVKCDFLGMANIKLFVIDNY